MAVDKEMQGPEFGDLRHRKSQSPAEFMPIIPALGAGGGMTGVSQAFGN